MLEVQLITIARKQQNPQIAEKLFADLLEKLPRDNPLVVMTFNFSYATFKIKTEKKVTDNVKVMLENALKRSREEYLGDTLTDDDQKLLQYVLDAANACFTHEAYELAWRLYLRTSCVPTDLFTRKEDKLDVFYNGMQALNKLPATNVKPENIKDFHYQLYHVSFNRSDDLTVFSKALELLMFNGNYYLQQNQYAFAEPIFARGVQLTRETELEYFVSFRLK